MNHAEHLIITTIVSAAEWTADATAVLDAARARLHQQTQHRGLTLQDEPTEDVTVLHQDQRVRIILTARADTPH